MAKNQSTFLTDAAVKRIEPPDSGQRDYPDPYIPGLYLRVSSKGNRSWCFMYRLKDGSRKQRRITFGRYPALGLAEARDKARPLYEQTQRGEDPAIFEAAKRREAARQRSNLFKTVAADFIERYCKPKNKTWEQQKRLLDRHVVPLWGDFPVSAITRRDAIELVEDLVRDHSKFTAHNVRAVAMKLFKWAGQRDMVDVNPFSMTEPPVSAKKSARDRVLRDEEVRAIWSACEEIGYPFGHLVQFLLLTGQRRGETSTIKWYDIDFDDRVWHIAREDTKADRAHDVPLSDDAVALLKDCPRFGVGEYVFTTTGGHKPLSGFAKPKAMLDVSSGVEGWRLHDLRRTLATNMAEHLSVPIHTISRVLNHAEGGVTHIYARASYMKEKRAALDKWSRHLQRIVDGRAESNVVSFTG